ncbi:TPR domain protein [Citrifermentans bemidjiense Bem]|uniref:TPR domain protein n=1 Tax=Citrifermentans bemidjiense (strain ATCC BAA-1014 / DSM 16622 / JCM 12645 / Bem) TaxID=404380 RepID=B5EH24_CITBB|nr:tetratricopeptide repeat protein [Citrifermentans bemidjiense]ACH38126.1 TPR domain protein [Citrifermentans bemidjiense Bem]
MTYTRSTQKHLLVFLILALVGLAAYGNTFSVPFQFDDDAYIVNNPAIKDFNAFISPGTVTGGAELSPTAIPPALRVAFMTRIVGYLSLAVDYHIHGLQVAGYHIVNLALHIINAWLVYLVLGHLFGVRGKDELEEGSAGIRPLPLIGALLFLCHPIQTHAVTYVTSRFVLLASFFSLLALTSYLGFREAHNGSRAKFYLALCVVSASLGMLTKEFTFTLPFVIALYEFSFFPGTFRDHLRKVWPVALAVPIIPGLIFLQKGQLTALGGTMRTLTAADSSGIGRLDYLLTQFNVVAGYLRLLLFPLGQNVDHDFAVQHNLAAPAVLLPLLLLLCLFGWAAVGYVRSLRAGDAAARVIPFGILWFFMTLSVESSIIPLGELSAEYRLYLPSLGVIIVLCWLADRACLRLSAGRRARFAAALVVIGMLGTLTILRNSVWQSEISLWRDAVKKSPAKLRPHQNLALYYGKAGRLEEARQELQQAIAIKPDDFELHNNLGIVYRQQGNLDAAILEYERALQLEPADAMARYNLGNAYLGRGRYQEALEQYQSCLKLIPDYDDLHNNMGIVYNKAGQSDAAIKEFQEALRLNPANAHARRNLESSMNRATR